MGPITHVQPSSPCGHTCRDAAGTPRLHRQARPACAALALAFALLSGPARAQDNDGFYWLERMNQIVVTATRTPVRVQDVPAFVTIKTDTQIADELVSDIKDLVRFEPGVSVRQAPARFGATLGATGRDGASGFTIRGLEGNRVLIQVDGIRVPDGFEFGAQAAGRGNYVDLGLIKSVEILRGPASALYGSDGLAGAVSFTTADPADLLRGGAMLGGRVQAGYEAADREFSETALIAARSGALSGMIAYSRRDGHELANQGTITAPNATRTAPNPQDTRTNALLGKLVLETGPSSRLRLTGEYERGTVATDVLSGVAPVASAATSVIALTARDTTARQRLALDWRREAAGSIDVIQLALYWQDGESRQFTAEDRNSAADRTRLNLFRNRVIGGAAELRSNFVTGQLAHQLAWGADASITRQTGLRDGTVPTPPDVFPTRAFPVTDFILAGAYLSDRITLAGGRVQLYPALRFDHYALRPQADPLLPGFAAARQSGSRVSPKIGAVVTIVPAVSLFANYAHGFKAPAPSQVNQFFENPGSQFGAYRSITNPALKPETSRTIEGGLRLTSPRVVASLTAFSGRFDNFISQETIRGTGTVADPIIFQFINLTDVRIDGLEGKLDLAAGHGLTGQVAVSWARGDSRRGGVATPLASIDPLKLVLGLGWRDPAERLGGQLTLTHAARKEESRAVAGAYRPAAFTILDATVFLKASDALTLRAGLFNILDRTYAWWSDVRGLAASSTVTDAYTQPGRNASVSLSYRF
ncbi:TonB-dependent hemoglobin/transferrin/lactoferrin family receptor [Novosphingobium piscinae]|uniref:TonB-dependent hemoglobin/transferrin/lactoferrin family receptor n=1 Tax=Novosphingobium piscinae TaxID=1507448 RepID=A0A7X1FWF8_9SPHN|nr:TonB-dependent hemoglobin/transferrin/lactoferrin family receptor [Novosphingobium piscinae]MBC2667622.1 TonB-dependent hemoglobin/transferrin/lactoferrin family receptor [Novosphingobium piscinae]